MLVRLRLTLNNVYVAILARPSLTYSAIEMLFRFARAK
jgi:hypothetical protein